MSNKKKLLTAETTSPYDSPEKKSRVESQEALPNGNGRTGKIPTHLSGIQACMVRILSDGLPHTRTELFGCMSGFLNDEHVVHFHLSTIRAIIAKKGLDVRSERHNRKWYYRLVRQTPIDDGGS